MRRAGLAIGGVVLIGTGVALAFGWWWPSTAEATAHVSEHVRTVRVNNDSGDVTVRAADVERTTVRQTFEYRWDPPGDAYSMRGDTLVLAGCGWWCSVSYEVTVPAGAEVRGGVDSGELRLAGVASAEVHVDSGSVVASDIAGPATLEADSGDVTGERLRGPVTAKADSGDVRLTVAEPADVRAEVDSGNVELTVPPGPYRVEGDTDSGDRRIGVAGDPNAEHVLRLDTDSGDVTVRTAPARG